MNDIFNPAWWDNWENTNRSQQDVNQFMFKRMVDLKTAIDNINADYKRRVLSLENVTAEENTQITAIGGTIATMQNQATALLDSFNSLNTNNAQFLANTTQTVTGFQNTLTQFNATVNTLFNAQAKNASDILLLQQTVDPTLIASLIKTYEQVLDSVKTDVDAAIANYDNATVQPAFGILNNRVSAEIQRATAAETSNSTALGSLSTQVGALQQSLTQQVIDVNNALSSGIRKVNDRIDSLRQYVDSEFATAETYTDTSIAAEQKRATDAETAESTRAVDAENTLRKAIDDERRSRKDDVATLQANIDKEEQSRLGDVANLQANIDKEEQSRLGDVFNLQTSINNEEQSRLGDVSNLQTRIDSDKADFNAFVVQVNPIVNGWSAVTSSIGELTQGEQTLAQGQNITNQNLATEVVDRKQQYTDMVQQYGDLVQYVKNMVPVDLYFTTATNSPYVVTFGNFTVTITQNAATPAALYTVTISNPNNYSFAGNQIYDLVGVTYYNTAANGGVTSTVATNIGYGSQTRNRLTLDLWEGDTQLSYQLKFFSDKTTAACRASVVKV